MNNSDEHSLAGKSFKRCYRQQSCQVPMCYSRDNNRDNDKLYEATQSKFRGINCIFILIGTNENASYSSERSVSKLLFYSLTLI